MDFPLLRLDYQDQFPLQISLPPIFSSACGEEYDHPTVEWVESDLSFPTTLLGILDEKARKMSWGEGRQEDEHLKIDMQNYIVVKIII